jgi:hypothetical protein
MCAYSQLVTWWEIMQRFDAAGFFYSSHGFTWVERGDERYDRDIVDDALRGSGIELAIDLIRVCSALGLSASNASAKRLLFLFREPKSTEGQLRNLMSELRLRIQDELNANYFFHLDLAEAKRYEDWGDGWTDIISRFGNVARDVEEMGKCFALNRYTAAIFHSLQVAEWGAIYLGDYIGAADPKKGWVATERKLRELIKGGHGKLPDSLAGHFDFLEQMNREINTMVSAWRHKIDHAANRLAILPNTDFTPEVAEHIIGAVRVFMRRLADGIPVES